MSNSVANLALSDARDDQGRPRAGFDTPAPGVVGRIVRASGWWLSRSGQPAASIALLVEGKPVAQACRSLRLDVARIYPDIAAAGLAGFFGDMILPQALSGKCLNFAARFTLDDGSVEEIDVGSDFILDENSVAQPVPQAKLDDLWSAEALTAIDRTSAEIDFVELLGVPHFLPRGSCPAIRLLETGVTHAYPSNVVTLIEDVAADGRFLDLGCGIRPANNVRANGVYLDAVHFPGVDVVNSCPRLPFKDEAFELVFSMAVFEHLPDPQAMAKEMLRVVKPGGLCYVETAFMQPFHGDPDHYFNMTESGLRRIFRGADILELGVASHQRPSDGLLMQIESVLPLIRDSRWGEWFRQAEHLLRREGRDLDDHLGPLGCRTLSAGVSILVRRPGMPTV